MRHALMMTLVFASPSAVFADDWEQRQFENRQVENRQVQNRIQTQQFENQQFQNRVNTQQQEARQLENRRVNRLAEQREQEARDERFEAQETQRREMAKRTLNTYLQPQVPLRAGHAPETRAKVCAQLDLPSEQFTDQRLTGYFIDSDGQPFFQVAERFGVNGLDGSILTRVKIISGRVPTLALPQPADVTVTLLRGGRPFEFKASAGWVALLKAVANSQKGMVEVDLKDIRLELVGGDECYSASHMQSVAAWLR